MLLAAALALSIPLHFEPNQGQAPASTRFVAAAPAYTLFLSDTGIAMQFHRSGAVTMNLPRTRVEALDPLPGRTNYYLGAGRSTWRTDVPNYARARYRSVFPGVDLAIYGKSQQIEYDWIVAPGADPAAIRFSFSGASHIRIDTNGDLVIDTPAGEVRHRRPNIYQSVDGRTHPVDGAFALLRGQVRFRIGAYDKRLPLVIDPKLIFAAGFGGSGIPWDFPMAHYTLSDTGTGIAVDKNGNIIIAGTTFSANFPQVNSKASGPTVTCTVNCVYRSVFVSKLSADGSTLLYSTYIAAPTGQTPVPYDGSPLPGGIAFNPANGNVYITGGTDGENFPLSGTATTVGGLDAFVVELDSNGALVNSALIGGSGDDAGTSIVFGPDGGLYLAGTTQSPNFPTTAGAYQTVPSASGQNIFLAKLDPSKLTAIYSTYLGPGDSPIVAPDSVGNAWVAASTTYASWTTSLGAAQSQCAGSPCADVILLRMNPAASQLAYATYFGGSATETLGGLTIDASGSPYISGTTMSTDLPTTTGAFQTTWNYTQYQSYSAAFVAKFTLTAKLVYATYIAGSSYDQGHGIAVDSAGNAYVAGQTTSPDFPLANPLQASPYYYVCGAYTVSGQTPIGETFCSSGGFLSALNANGTELLWSTYLSGAAWANTLDASGNVYITGVDLDITTPAIAPSKTASVGVIKIAPQGAGLQFSANSIVNAASYHPGLPSPGGLASLFVTGLNVTGTQVASGNPLPTELAGVQILVQGVPAPILAVADIPDGGYQQINFQVPFEIDINKVNLVEVRYQGYSTFSIPQTVAPGIFILSDGTPAVQHAADYSLVTPSNPIKPGEAVIVYLTGLGQVVTPVASGVPSTGPDQISAVGTGGAPEDAQLGSILYMGLAPGFVGLYQMNIQVASNLPPGPFDFYVFFPQSFGPQAPLNFAQSNTVTLPIQ
jgi:uncharacterized protein (TIGR03437 family)